MCQSNDTCFAAYNETGVYSICAYYGNPWQGTLGFDNIMLSMFNIFQCITLEGWTDMMYTIRESEQTWAYDILFLMCVVIGAMVILNLMVAV